MSGAGPKKTQWPHLAVISTVVAVSFGSLFYAYSVLITDEAAGGRFSTTVLSTAYAGMVLFGGVLAYAVGRTADRRGVRPLILTGSVLGASGLLVLSVASAPWHVIAASWLLMGPAAAMTFYEPAFIAVDQWFGHERRGPAIAVLTLVGGLAGPIFLPVTGALVDAIEWRPTARLLALGLLVVGLAGSALLPGHRGDRRVQVKRPRLRNLVGERRFVLFTISIMLSFGALQAVFFHRVAVFEDAGFAVALAAGWAGVSSLLSFPGRFAAPLVRGRFGGLFLYSVLTLAASIAVVFMVLADETWMMVTHFVLFGLAFGGMLPLRAVVMGRWFSGSGYGSIMGAQWSLAAFAGALAPWLVGVARDAVGSYDAPMTVVAGLLVVSGLLGLAATADSSRAAPFSRA